MPIYEYQCQACNKITDALQKMSDAPLLTCPECNEEALKKLVSAPRFRLAGSGWYETDFKDSNKRNLVSSDDKSSKSEIPGTKTETSKSSESTSTETKSTSSESKSESKSNGPSTSSDGKAA